MICRWCKKGEQEFRADGLPKGLGSCEPCKKKLVDVRARVRAEESPEKAFISSDGWRDKMSAQFTRREDPPGYDQKNDCPTSKRGW